jgi:hypothetical protein
MQGQLTIRVAEEGADAERVDALTGYLRQELRELDVDDVARAPGGDAPPGSRAVDPAAIGALLVTLSGAATSINEIVTVVRGWLARGSTPRTVRIEMDGDVLELSGASAAQQDELISVFVRRHGGT